MKANIKKTTVILILVLVSMMAVSCRKTPKPTPSPTLTTTARPTGTATASVPPIMTATATPTGTAAATETAVAPTETADMKTTASIVNNAAAFEKAIGKNGTWIICLLNDLNINKDLVLDGQFKNNKGETQRKIALYEQDANKKVTARYKLTAPKLTINSPNARIQSGTFKGDIYVNADKFQLVDTTVEGNVYFTSDAFKSAFTMDAASKVTGVQQVKKK